MYISLVIFFVKMSIFKKLVKFSGQLVSVCDAAKQKEMDDYIFNCNLNTLYFLIEKCDILCSHPQFAKEGIYLHDLFFGLTTKPNIDDDAFYNYFEYAYGNEITHFIEITSAKFALDNI